MIINLDVRKNETVEDIYEYVLRNYTPWEYIVIIYNKKVNLINNYYFLDEYGTLLEECSEKGKKYEKKRGIKFCTFKETFIKSINEIKEKNGNEETSLF